MSTQRKLLLFVAPTVGKNKKQFLHYETSWKKFNASRNGKIVLQFERSNVGNLLNSVYDC